MANGGTTHTQSQATYAAEHVDEIFQRKRPQLPEQCLDFGKTISTKKGPSTICVTGHSGSGKTMLMMELIIRAILLPNEANPEVLLVNIDKDFNILKLVELSMKLVNHDPNNDPDHDHIFVREKFKRLHILTSTKPVLSKIIEKIEQTVASNSNISLVLIDSLGPGLFEAVAKAAQKDIPMSKESYIVANQGKLSDLARKFGITVVFTKPEYLYDQLNCRENFTQEIRLEKLSDVEYKMTQRLNGEEKQVSYTIDFYGIRVVE